MANFKTVFEWFEYPIQMFVLTETELVYIHVIFRNIQVTAQTDSGTAAKNKYVTSISAHYLN